LSVQVCALSAYYRGGASVRQIGKIKTEMNEIIKSPDMLRQNRIPPGQRETNKWPVLHYGSVPNIDITKWKFRIFGLVDKEVELSYSEFNALPPVKVYSDIHCVTRWSKLDNLWEGVGTSTLRDLTNIDPQAGFAIIHAAGNFTTNLSLDDFFQPDVLLALRYNSEALTPEHGYPVRLVVPRLYFWKSAKWVTGVEFTTEDRPGFWESNGYHYHGDPWKEERYSSF
jgi:DMSO/TMAO reductase YedYZ molybdopterin-dependent catalytic subunit